MSSDIGFLDWEVRYPFSFGLDLAYFSASRWLMDSKFEGTVLGVHIDKDLVPHSRDISYIQVQSLRYRIILHLCKRYHDRFSFTAVGLRSISTIANILWFKRFPQYVPDYCKRYTKKSLIHHHGKRWMIRELKVPLRKDEKLKKVPSPACEYSLGGYDSRNSSPSPSRTIS